MKCWETRTLQTPILTKVIIQIIHCLFSNITWFTDTCVSWCKLQIMCGRWVHMYWSSRVVTFCVREVNVTSKYSQREVTGYLLWISTQNYLFFSIHIHLCIKTDMTFTGRDQTELPGVTIWSSHSIHVQGLDRLWRD